MNIVKKILLLFIFLPAYLPAQEIITIIEKDRDGNYRDKNDPAKIKEGYTDNKVADINSVLDIRINLDSVTSRVSRLYANGLPDHLAEKITSIVSALRERNQTLTRIEAIVNSYDYEKFRKDDAAFQKYISELAAESGKMLKILAIDDRIKKEYFRLVGDDEMYTGVYVAAAKILPELEKEFENYATENGIYVQFGGWLVTKSQNVPIHLEGFDDITPQAPYLVDRWQFIPTEDQLKQLKEMQQLARDNRDLGLSILRITAQNQLNALKSVAEQKIQQLAEKLDREVTQAMLRLGRNAEPKLVQVLDSMHSLAPVLASYTSGIQGRLNYYKDIFIIKDVDVQDFLVHAESDISFITGEGLRIKNKIEAITNGLAALQPVAVQLADSSRIIFENLRDEFLSDYRSFIAVSKNKASEFIYGVQMDMAALQFGSDVYKLALTDLPSSVELDLVNTGIRADGDRLVLKIAVSDKNSKQSRTLETREIYLFRVLPHVITTVGVVFADPLANTNIESQFQMAPSCNFLFKGLGDQKCRRKSVAYNRLFDWGFGLHLAAPDFDKDDIPEIAAGVVISTLHDYLQGGFAFNIFTGDPYWFFGLRFPVPTFNIGASSQVQTE